jgi:hypothetical protein
MQIYALLVLYSCFTCLCENWSLYGLGEHHGLLRRGGFNLNRKENIGLDRTKENKGNINEKIRDIGISDDILLS